MHHLCCIHCKSKSDVELVRRGDVSSLQQPHGWAVQFELALGYPDQEKKKSNLHAVVQTSNMYRKILKDLLSLFL